MSFGTPTALSSVTIFHVAERAGVSIKTVSRVLNGERYVRETLRERVLAAARELNYRPQLSARSLGGRRSYLIALLMPHVSPYALYAQMGALEACAAAGCHLMVETLEPGAAEAVVALARSLPTDGLLQLPPLCDDPAVLDTLDAQGIAYVRISPGTRPQRGLSVSPDDEAAACELTNHLLDLGHRRIGFVKGLEDHAASRRRLRGYRKALAGRGLEVDDALVMPGRFLFESGRAAAERLLTLRARPTAIFAGNDLCAAGVMAQAHDMGLRLPDELSVTGFDDDWIAPMVWPALTTMRQPIAAIAAAAANMLIQAAAGAAGPARRARPFACELVVRQSTAPPPVTGA